MLLQTCTVKHFHPRHTFLDGSRLLEAKGGDVYFCCLWQLINIYNSVFDELQAGVTVSPEHLVNSVSQGGWLLFCFPLKHLVSYVFLCMIH